MFVGRREILLLLMLGMICVSGLAQLPGEEEKDQLKPTLVADTTAIEAGKPFTAGVRIILKDGWYTYWRFVGGIGLPLEVVWELPPGFKAGPLQWPMPVSHGGDFFNYIYERETLLFAEITPPATLAAGRVTLKAKVDWQACDPARCVPGDATVTLELPAGSAQPANAELFAKWRAQIPKTTTPPFQVEWQRDKADELAVRIAGLPKEVNAEFFPLPPSRGVATGHPKASDIADDGTRTITIPIEKGGAPNLPWEGVIVTKRADDTREGWQIAAPVAQASVSATSGAASPAAKTDGSLLWKLLFAFLGGLIMNVMPCVLPVIALKIFGFVHQAHEAPAQVFRLGLAFNAGVFAFFLGLAAAVARLKIAFNWGYQFQNPYLLAALIAMVFVFAFSLLGVFEVTLGGGTATKLNELSSREGYGGAFMHGFFTTLLGTSCTAPFLATSLSFATTQSTPVIFLLFTAIAAGMCLPYFLLTWHPAWMKYMPKPGAWMERVKQIMGFLMLAVAVWLFTILGLRGAQAITGMSWFLLALGVACWLFGSFNGSLLARLAALLIPVAAYFLFLDGKLNAASAGGGTEQRWKTGSIEWITYTDERLAEARNAGAPVFIDFTAEWCINCKTYERLVLATEPIGAKFREKKVVPLRADWTNTDDPVVTRALKSFGRVGVPLYVLYRPGESAPVVLDALTTGTLLAELDLIKN